MPEKMLYGEKMAALKCCILIPTYNNAKTLEQVIRSVSEYTHQVLVVNDGATDETPEILLQFPYLKILTHPINRGKGIALRHGFEFARQNGFDYCITIDSDGQHNADDLPKFIDTLETERTAIIMGARNMEQSSVPGKSSFGNNFSNFWFRFETGIKLPDTQTGYRLYPLKAIEKLHFFTSKFEFEIEVIVKAAWSGISILSVPVSVYYAPKETRVSHFRPVPDFTRVSILNVYLVIWAVLWYIPIRFIKSLTPKNIKLFVHKHFLNPEESLQQKSVAIGFGVFMGIVPIWGFQLLSGLAICHWLKINKAIFVTAAHISVAPLIPFVVYLSFLTGGWVLNEPSSIKEFTTLISLDAVKQNFFQYVVGSMVLATLAGLLIGLFSYFCMIIYTKIRGGKA
jgi:glycosyltransferase involved in cell wall biosynthesis